MITCEEFAQRVTAYLEGTVPMGERMGLWLHKVMCHHCRRYFNQMKLVVDLIGEVPEVDTAGCPDQATKQDLLEEFRQRRAPEESSEE
jgi:predicted anti-sigma-YlaC factor YlaD